ncbi:MAG: hypothetical protein LBP21_06970 [Synergistaceae bacterium]|nr:hypothetical protein [Synergistaceae bacterium]
MLLAGGLMCWPGPAYAAPVISAYQEPYAMNFEICWMAELPAGWYVTFDGYPVAQIAPNRWVYGRVRRQKNIVPTEVLVGAVVPMDVPELARVAIPSPRSCVYQTKAFQSIALSGLDNMGVLDDPLAYTPVAWKTGVAGLRIWLGNRWHSIVPASGQTTSQALLAKHPYIVKTLRSKNLCWKQSDTQDLADLAREWGYIWRGAIPFASFTGRRDDNGAGGERESFAGSSGAAGVAGTVGGGDWDVGGGASPAAGGGGGGGWDTGGGSSPGGGNGGGGWDSGGGGVSPGGGNGGGWDK